MEHWLVEMSRKFNDDPTHQKNGVHFLDDPEDNAFINDLQGFPHAYVLACLMDKQVKAEKAWVIPCVVRRACGGDFSIGCLASHDLPWYQHLFQHGGEGEKPLHRFPVEMPEVFFEGVRRISQEYGGDASRIWGDRPSSAALVLRFLQFQGAGIKIATMAANILVRQYGVQVSDYYSIDVSPDTHLQRVFYRMGLIGRRAKREEIVYKARELCPEYPGIMDSLCWHIGREQCDPIEPHCSLCPAREHCLRIEVPNRPGPKPRR